MFHRWSRFVHIHEECKEHGNNLSHQSPKRVNDRWEGHHQGQKHNDCIEPPLAKIGHLLLVSSVIKSTIKAVPLAKCLRQLWQMWGRELWECQPLLSIAFQFKKCQWETSLAKQLHFSQKIFKEKPLMQSEKLHCHSFNQATAFGHLPRDFSNESTCLSLWNLGKWKCWQKVNRQFQKSTEFCENFLEACQMHTQKFFHVEQTKSVGHLESKSLHFSGWNFCFSLHHIFRQKWQEAHMTVWQNSSNFL